jgi:hypothetical protein
VITAQTEKAHEAARAAEQEYRRQCEERGVNVDPIMADETYQRALHKALGQHRYCGD